MITLVAIHFVSCQYRSHNLIFDGNFQVVRYFLLQFQTSTTCPSLLADVIGPEAPE
jgi:hypothetical protein